LWRHGSFLRSFESVAGSKIPIWILRLCCSNCEATHACLFPCLVPGSSYSAESLGKLVGPYFFEKKSCDGLGWESRLEEGEGHRHLVHKVVDGICEKQERIESFVEKEVQKSGESLWKRKEPEPETPCPNAKKARTERKKAALTRLRAVLEKFREQSGREVETLVSFLHETSMQLRAPFSLLSRAKVRVFVSPQNRGEVLF
jgi:hypothetical protein